MKTLRALQVILLLFAFIFIRCGKDDINLDLDVPECYELAVRFDTLYYDINETYEPESLIVGGWLISIADYGGGPPDYYAFGLTFVGKNTSRELFLASNNDKIPYKTGKFYKFDLYYQWKNTYSSALSGVFSDPDLDRLIEVDCE